MAWTAEKVKAMRESNPAKAAQSDEWTAEKVRAMRTKTPTAAMQRTAPAAAAAPAADAAPYDEAFSSYGQLAQKFKAGTEALEQKSDRLDALNQWYDDPHNQQLVADLTAKKDPFTTYAQQGTSRNAASAPAPLRLMGNSNYGLPTTQTTESKYTDEQLKKRGYSAGEIGQGRQYLKEINEIPEAKQQARRILNTAGGIADTVEAAPLLAGEYIVQTKKNADALAALKTNDHDKRLVEAIQRVDGTNGAYTDADLVKAGWSGQEIAEMRAKMKAAQQGIDPEQSLGYQIYNRGQKLNAAAQSGLSPAAKTAQGIVSSAAENLVVGSVNPALVLPVLSAQGAAEAMGRSVEKNESAGKALAGGLAKFGAGWAINSVGAADLARSMGSDYAKDTMAGQIADWVRGLAGDGALAQNYPAVANALSGGIDNAMQAFVETYADQAIDAALGDEEAARTMFNKDTFLTALESGLSGGASGALGGAVGTGLGAMRERAARAEAAEQAQAAETRQRKAWERSLEPGEAKALAAGTPSQTADAASSPKGGALGKEGSIVQNPVSGAEETAVNENLAVQQFAEAAAEDSLTGKTIRLFAPEAGNEANRAAFEEAYGVQLPGTAAATRRMLRDIAAQQQATMTTEMQAPAGNAGSGNKSANTARETALSASKSPENVRNTPETGMNTEPARVEAQPQMQAVENPGETVEKTALEDVTAPMRETYGLEAPKTQEQKAYYTEQKMRGWDVSEKAAKHLSQQLPKDVNADTYVAAASSLYRLGQMEDVDTFDKALRLAGSENALGLNVNEVLSQTTGRNALEQAYLYGKGEREARAKRMQQLGGALGPQSTSGEGVTYYRETQRQEDSVASQIISLNAQGTGTDAVLKSVLNGPDGAPNPNVKAKVDTETARIFFGDRAENVFQTVLHEDYHWYNALDSEGAKTLQDHALQYLAKNSGYENIDELIRAKMGDYAAQKLTYEQAAEELVADAWGGIFDSEESFRRWAQFQREQAEKNAGKAGTIHKVMQQVKNLLENILSKAKEVLRMDPENAAAQKAQRLAEAEKRALQEEYFAHAEKAMDNLRAAKADKNKNTAALKTESAAEKLGTRYAIRQDANGEAYIDIDEDILKGVPQEDWKATVKQAIKERFPNGFERNGWRIENTKDGRGEFIRSKYSRTLERTNAEVYTDKMRMAANLDEIIKTADEVYREPAKHKNAEAFNRGKIQIKVGGNLYTADVVTAFKIDDREIFYDIVNIERTNKRSLQRTDAELKEPNGRGQPEASVETSGKAHMESEDSGSSGSGVSIKAPGGTVTREENSNASRLPGAFNKSIAQTSAERNRTDEPVKKITRFQIDSGFEKAIDELDANSKYAYPIRVGTTSEVLKSIGVKDQTIVWNSNKIRKILAKHSAENFRTGADHSIMTKEIIKQVPQVLEHPILVVHSDTTRNADYASRIFMYGDVKDATGKPVNVSLELLPTDYKGLAMENIVVLSAYGHDAYRPGRVLQGEILYADPNTKRTSSWLRDNRLLLPFSLASAGSKAILRYSENGVKAVTVEQLPGQRKYYLKSITEEQAQKLYPAETERTDTQPAVNRLQLPLRMAEYGSEDSVRSAAENVKADEKTNVRFQMAENADKEARKNTQRQASRAIAERDASLKTLMDFFGITRGVRISDDSMESLALKTIYAAGAKGKMNATEFAGKLRPLVEYMKADGADMSKAQSMAEVLAGEALDHATTRNTELWDQYPELHSLSYTVAKDGQAEKELVRRYGSWGAAVKDARSHGVQLRREAGTRDGNPAEQYESIVNDTRAVGGVKDGTAALFRHAAESAGVAGASSMESTEWLDVLMNVHDAIKPRMMSRFADAAEYEDAKVELAGQMLGNVMNLNEMKDVQAIFDGIQKHNRAVAAAAAGSEERAAEVLKGLKSVQKEQTRLFNQKLRENSRPAVQSEDARAAAQQEQRNRQAEKLLDQNLDTLGVDITNMGDLNEKLEVLRETYEREWNAEKKRLRDERRQMLDEIALERRQLKAENAELARQVAGEQRRADRAERQLIFQENDILEWEQENQRKAEAWQQEQAQRNAIAIEAARQQRDEDIAVAKALAEKRGQKARDARKADELKRSIRSNAAALNQMILRPQPGKYVSKALMTQAMEVAKLADATILNQNAVNRLAALETSIREAGGGKDSTVVSAMSEDWKQSGIAETLAALRADLTASKEAKLARLNEQLTEAKALPDSEKARALQDRLKMRIRETENRTYLPLTVDQLRALKAITTSALHVIRNANKTLSLEKAQEVDAMALTAANEVGKAKGNEPGEKWSGVRGALTRYNLDMLGGVRVFRMLGGYTKNGQMEQLATMLNDGQRKQTQILVEGEALFDNVTGKSHVKEMERFAGPGADLVDVGLKDTKGHAVPLTHAQLCSLYMHLKNADSRNHLLTGGLTLPDAKLYHKGKIEEAYQKGQNVMLGNLMNADGTPMADTILQTVEKALTDYDRAWCEDMKDFFGRYTTNLINETSLKLLGYQRATVKDYYPIAVDKTQLATEIEGLKLDATIEGRGFLKNRQKSAKPILLEECSNVVQRSLRDTADYAGLAAPLRDVQKVLNSSVKTAEGVGILKNKIIQEHWGEDAVDYINELLTDLHHTGNKTRKSSMTALRKLRGNYAGAILTLNPGVAIAQAASLPTAGAVLGADTMAAVVPFVKNLSGKQRAALETEIAQHGDALLRYRMRGAQVGELSSLGKNLSLAEKGMDKAPKWVTGWINSMDEITVAALWEGAKRYVEHHETLQKGSEAYWEAVNKTYQKVIEETQPNYTTMQRAGIQRNDNELVKALTMFTTQRFQNYGILADAVGDYNAQKARYKTDASAENEAEVERAGKQLNRAVTSQLTQTAVFALMKIGADFLLHRWDREQDENGDITGWSLFKRYADLFASSAMSNPLFGSELYGFVSNVAGGKMYDVVSVANVTAINDLSTETMRFYKLLRTDTSEMSEKELAAYHEKVHQTALNLISDGMEVKGLPAGNAGKLMTAAWKWGENIAYAATKGEYGEKLSFHSLPGSAMGQYDRLYNAIQSGDSEEAQAALDKLDQMKKNDKIDGELKKRLKKNSPEVEEAAEARNAGNDAKRQNLTKQLIREMYRTLGIREGVKEDAGKREQVIDLVTGAINQKGDELLAGGTDGSVYDDLAEALDSGRARDVQDEVDRLLTAGKKPDSLKTKVTSLVKEEYLAGNDRDREKLEAMLLKLTDGDGKPLYEKKNFEQWAKQAKKQEEKSAGAADEWAALR